MRLPIDRFPLSSLIAPPVQLLAALLALAALSARLSGLAAERAAQDRAMEDERRRISEEVKR
jgi:hypothetical protein